MLRSLALALALLAAAAPAAAAHTDAEIFATDNTAVITDPDDPRLDDRLIGFARRVERIIEQGGGRPRGSELLDGVFAAPELTFERSRRFDVDDVERRRAARHRRDRPAPLPPAVRAHLRPPPAGRPGRRRRRARGAGRERPRAARGPARRCRGARAAVRRLGHARPPPAARRRARGRRVRPRRSPSGSAATCGAPRPATATASSSRWRPPAARGSRRARLLITGTAEDDTVALREGRRLEIDFGDDGIVDFEVSRHRFDRVRVELGEGQDRLIQQGGDRVHLRHRRLRLGRADRRRARRRRRPPHRRRPHAGRDVRGLRPARRRRRGGRPRHRQHRRRAGAGPRSLGVAPNVIVLGPTFVQIEESERTDEVRMNGLGGDDLLSASTDLMKVTLDGGDGLDTHVRRPGRRRDARRRRLRPHRAAPRRRLRRHRPRLRQQRAVVARRRQRRRPRRHGHSRRVVLLRLEPTPSGSSSRRTAAALASRVTSATSSWTSTASRSIDSVSGAGTDLYRIGDMRGTDIDELNAEPAAGRRGRPRGDRGHRARRQRHGHRLQGACSARCRSPGCR